MDTSPTDELLRDLARYTAGPLVASEEAYATARLCLLDSLGCALLSLNYPECTKLLGPVVPGATCANGARVACTPHELDPVQAAFNLGTMIRWLDFNDTWLAAEWGHPSDNLGAILPVADWLARNQKTLAIRDVLEAMIKAYEIQGVLALENSFNRVGLDHVLLVRVASTAVVTRLLGGDEQQIQSALSQAFIDGGALRTYRHAPNTGSRKSWAAGDAASRAVRLALWSMQNEMGYPSALTTPTWGFQDVLFKGETLRLAQPLGCYVMENILFKVAYPAEFHAQTAVEAALQLHPEACSRLDEIQQIRIETHESAMRIIDKTGSLLNPAARDHCLQYMVAVALLHGNLTADHYEDQAAADPRIDALRDKMVVVEEPRYSADYLDPQKRSIANAVQVFFGDGAKTQRIEVEYPPGHRRRREEAVPQLVEKFTANAATRWPDATIHRIVDLFAEPTVLDSMNVDEFVSMTVA